MMPSSNSPIARRAGRFACGALAAAMLACLATGPALAQSSIRVLVNDVPITSLDIQQQTKMIKIFTRGQQGEKQAIDQLIEQTLMLQEAKRRNVDITDAELDEEFASRARASKLTAAQFTQAMRQAGIDPQTFKNFLRANLAWAQVVRARFRATVNVTDSDVAAALTEHEAPAETEQQTAMEYRLQPILFVVPQGAGAGVEAKQRSEANAFRTAFQGCDQSLQQVSGRTGIVVKPQVRREAGSLAPDLKEALAKTEVGGTTDAERVPEGIQIIAVCAKTPIPGQTEAAVQVREEISTERGQLLARRYLRDLRSDAVIEYR